MKRIFIFIFVCAFFMPTFSQANFNEAGKTAINQVLTKSYFGIGDISNFHAKFFSIEDSITPKKNKLLLPYKKYISWRFSNLAIHDVAENNFIPVFVQFKGKPCIIICGVVHNKVLNTRVMETPGERASHIWEKLGKELFSKISNKQNNKAPFYTGIHIVYTTSDFSNQYDIERTEDVLFIAPTNSIKSYADMNITESNFYKTVNVFVRPRKSSEVRLIK